MGGGEGRAAGREPSGRANTNKEATEESAFRTHRAGRHKPAGMSVWDARAWHVKLKQMIITRASAS
eukprot:5444941-Pleurochrysis_carterae.AAC.1